MKFHKYRQFLLLALFLGFAMLETSCKTGEGCDNQEQYQVKTDKDGNLTSKRGSSNLFSKKQRKKMGSRSGTR